MTRGARRPVTMQDVGERAGVTSRTVSNVLSGKVHVRPETRDAVLRAVAELGYQLNVSARGLRTGLTGFITLAIPDLAIDYFAELAHFVLAEAERHGWTVVIQQTGARRDTELAVLSGAHRQLSDGLIFQPHALGPGDERVLAGDGPLVLLGDRIFHGPVDHVTMANHDAAATATQHLIDRRCRAVAAVGDNPQGGPVSAAALRLAGYRAALERNGLPFVPGRVGVATEWHRADGAAAMHRLIDSDPSIDGVFCFNDTLAFGALHALAVRGLRVPEDVAVVGFDNVGSAAYSVPGLTTIDPGSHQIAKHAVDLLAWQLMNGPPEHPTEIVTQFSLVARRSA